MDRLLEHAFWIATISGGIRLATPLMFASIGETFSQRAGVLNIGLEGYMIIGALTSLYVAVETSTFIGLLAGAFGGMLVAAVMVGLSVRLAANQVVVGFGLTILCLGLTGYIFRETTEVGGVDRQVSRLSEIDLADFSDVPVIGWLGDAFLENSWITWLAVAMVPMAWWVAERTTFGLRVRAVGEDPDAAAARGVGVQTVRTQATLLSGLFGGLGGAALMLGQVGRFQPGVTANRGFVALIVIIMASWSIWGAALGSFVFGFFEAFGTNLRNVVSDDIPTEALQRDPVRGGPDDLGGRRQPGPATEGARHELRQRTLRVATLPHPGACGAGPSPTRSRTWRRPHGVARPAR